MVELLVMHQTDSLTGHKDNQDPKVKEPHAYSITCKKIERCLQFFGIKVLDQFFLRRKASDAFAGSYPVIEVDEPS